MLSAVLFAADKHKIDTGYKRVIIIYASSRTLF